MASDPDRILCLNPKPDAQGVRIAADRYHAMRRALLAVIPARGEGIRFSELKTAIADRLPKAVFAGASISWYLTVVKLDLEARGQIHRQSGRGPQRLRRGPA